MKRSDEEGRGSRRLPLEAGRASTRSSRLDAAVGGDARLQWLNCLLALQSELEGFVVAREAAVELQVRIERCVARGTAEGVQWEALLAAVREWEATHVHLLRFLATVSGMMESLVSDASSAGLEQAERRHTRRG